jgi:aryl-alcohol dehydrogenase-like predicted oxidoreductase
MAVMAAIMAARGVWAWTVPAEAFLFAGHPVQFLTYPALYLLLLVNGFAVLLLSKEALDQDLQAFLAEHRAIRRISPRTPTPTSAMAFVPTAKRSTSARRANIEPRVAMELRNFGNTGLRVSALGFGAMHINDARTSETEAGRLLNAVLDLGINLIDSARGYGLSEERIGRHLGHRRSEFVLSTKVGYGIPGQPDWTYDCIQAGVEAALRRLRTDCLDIVHLHSCPLATLERGEVIDALVDCQRAGKLRVPAYSGDNAERDFAIADGRFRSLQVSLSVCDQAAIGRLPAMAERGLGVIAKRPVAGSVWRHAERPDDFAEGQYWDRWQAMAIASEGMAWNELALRFAAGLPGVASCITGTANLDHLRSNLASVAKGPLPAAQVEAIRAAFATHAKGWPGLI